ncbi:MAG: patatin-like phospholipase family protein [Anaerolineales bacterium]|nr:patatin-like phospholipase family protein [Anaerolineales bacterium]
MSSPLPKRIGLALSGGIARAPTHIGVLAALERAKIPVDYVAGVSAGSILGAAYCAGLNLDEVREITLKIGWRSVARPVWSKDGFVSFDKLEKFLIGLVGDLTFAELKIPFVVQATDLETGEPHVFREGRIAPAIVASCSVPGFVVPKEIDGRLYGDGGVSNNLPVRAVRAMGAEYVIGVDLFRPSMLGVGPLRWGLWSIQNLVRRSGGELDACDCLIAPEMGKIGYVSFAKAAEMIALGEKSAEGRMGEIWEMAGLLGVAEA